MSGDRSSIACRYALSRTWVAAQPVQSSRTAAVNPCLLYTSLAQEDTTKTVEQLRQAEHAGQLPETDLFTILREWDTASGTALVPLMTEDGFSAAIATKTNLSAALSPDAVSGLCWLRGDNYPEQFSTESGSYTVSSAKTQLSAESCVLAEETV